MVEVVVAAVVLAGWGWVLGETSVELMDPVKLGYWGKSRCFLCSRRNIQEQVGGWGV